MVFFIKELGEVHFMRDIILNIVEWILEFIATIVGSFCQFIAGIIFNTMDKFLASDDNMIIKILKPVYNFSVNYLRDFSFGLLGLILAVMLLLTMFGKFSTSRDEPVVLLGRGLFFFILIAISPMIIGVIGGTASTTKGGSEPGLVIQLESTMLDVGTINDSNGSSAIQKSSNIGTNIKKTLNNGAKKVSNFLGITTERVDGDTGSEYTVTRNNKTTINDAASALIDVSMGSELSGFVLHFIGLGFYAVVYGIMILVIAWKCFKICSRFVYRFVIFLVLLYFCPVFFVCGPSKSTQRVFSEWVRMMISYAVLLIFTAAWMRLSTFVIYNSFRFTATSDLIQVIFAFLVSIMFLKMAYELEKYIEKLGLSAVGLPDSVSGFSSMLRGSISIVSFSLAREGVRSGAEKIKGMSSKPDFSIKTPESIQDEGINEAFGQGSKQYDEDGNEKDNLAQDILGKDNDNAFVSDPTGENMMGSDGIMHNESEFETDENGNMVLKDDDSVIAENPTERYSALDAGINTEGLNGLDDNANAFTNVDELKKNSALVSDDKGDYFMAKTPDGNIAIKKADLDDKNNTEYAITSDGNGNFKAKEWSSNKDGDKYRMGKNGNLVNVGDGKSYSYGNSRSDDAIPVRFESSSHSGSSVLNAKSGRIGHMSKYNENLPNGAKISAINNLEYCSTLYKAKDGTTTGIARQRLVDSDGKPTGETKFVKFTRYDNTEISKDEIARHRRATNRINSDRNPCEGYTPDGKHYIHIEKYMGERRKSTINEHRGPIVKDKAQ